jgi:hypothetical protein
VFKLAGLKELVTDFHGIENHGFKGCAQRARSALGNGTRMSKNSNELK